MKKTFRNSNVYRKERIHISFCIRLFLIVVFTLFYLITLTIPKDTNVVATDHQQSIAVQENFIKSNHHSRKLLSIINVNNLNKSIVTESNIVYGNDDDKVIIDNLKDNNDENRTKILIPSRINKKKNCTNRAILSFPSDGLTQHQRQHGWILIHIAISCYCFWLLATICDEYFVPAIDIMCFTLNMKEDVVGATFMAMATSSPELFINCIGTFITKGDLGVGTVVGAAVFNVLAVPACCGLFAGQLVQLDWWPLSRDCIMYGFSVIALIIVLLDGIIMWYEGLILVCAYLIYILAMYCNDCIGKNVRMVVLKCKRMTMKVRPYNQINEISPLLAKEFSIHSKPGQGNISMYPSVHQMESATNTSCNNNNNNNNDTMDGTDGDDDIQNYIEYASKPCSISEDTPIIVQILRWPITLVLWLTIPDCRKYPKLRILTFIMCIIWIAMSSYFVAFLITIVGDTINIPDSVMGLTFLAAGTSVPEAVSSVIVTNHGHGIMGISNSIGSNIFDILLCLGLPWFIKAYFLPAVPNEHWIELNSDGLTYSAIALLSTLFGLYIAFSCNGFRLDWKIGITCTVMYVVFLIVASLIELNVFFPVNLPICH